MKTLHFKSPCFAFVRKQRGAAERKVFTRVSFPRKRESKIRGKMKVKGYYFITDAGLSKHGNASDCREAMKAGVKIVQYRNKTGSTREMYEEALELRRICSKAIFLINDRIDIALAVNADGVHLGQDDMDCKIARKILGKKSIIGVTAHSINEAIKAQKEGASYIGLSPIFETTTKSDAGIPAGIKLIEQAANKISIPIVAIGGINLENVKQVIEAGANAFCAISCVITKNNVAEEIKKLQRLFK